MLNSIYRKVSQVANDPVLRRWLRGRVLGINRGIPVPKAHCPAYLEDLMPLAIELPSPEHPYRDLDATAPTQPITLELPGESITLSPGNEESLFSRGFDDLETELAVHRFAWLAGLRHTERAAWFSVIWSAWYRIYGGARDGWAWHPYTAGERAINILRFARTEGLPVPVDQTLQCFAAHTASISEHLEYFGERQTFNHLANNGRGLFLIGLYLGMPRAAEMGARILVREAGRIFMPSGMLREGSSHYQLLLARNYTESAEEAEAYGHPAASKIRSIANEVRAAAGGLILPAGLPLIGDISPDCPPDELLGSFDLTDDPPYEKMADDGWLRISKRPWSGLWYISPDGWRFVPGHGHEDCGSFEVHFERVPLFVDPGRGSYKDSSDFHCSGFAHNTLLVDGHNPFPRNRPYYDDAFRHRVCGDRPTSWREGSSVAVMHAGLSHIRGVGMVHRHWAFNSDSMVIADSVDGRGRHAILRVLVTPLDAEITGNQVQLNDNDRSFRVTAEGAQLSIEPITRWTAYGKGVPAHRILVQCDERLPWKGRIIVEAQ